MKRILYSLIMVTAMVCTGFLSSCKNEEGGAANAVIASTRAIEFPEKDSYPITLNITSDGDWHCDTPEWITLCPSTGTTGRTEVTVTVTDNIRDNAPDRPRKFSLKFMGEKSLSGYEVMVIQKGDKYRDLQPSSLKDLGSLEDDDAVMFSDAIVYSSTKEGMVLTDGTELVYAVGQKLPAGSKASVIGSKYEADKLPYVSVESLMEQGSAAIPALSASDITDEIDTYSNENRVLIKATGAFDGKQLRVTGMKNTIQVTDASTEIDLDALKGHLVTLTGVYNGSATPVVKMIATKAEDLGLNETLYFFEDFEWLTPLISSYVKDGKGVSDNVGKNLDNSADYYNPQMATIKNSDGLSTWDLMLAKGYEFLAKDQSQAVKSNGWGLTYLKISITTYTGGLKLPAIPELGDGAEGLILSFDWCPFAAKGFVYDPAEVVIILENGGKETQIPVPGHDLEKGEAYRWIHQEIPLDGHKVDKDTRISLRNCDAQFPESTAVYKTCRWFLDNIKIYIPKN